MSKNTHGVQDGEGRDENPTCQRVWRVGGVGEGCSSCKDGVWEPIKQVCLEAGEEAPPIPPFLAYKGPKKRNPSEPRHPHETSVPQQDNLGHSCPNLVLCKPVVSFYFL